MKTDPRTFILGNTSLMSPPHVPEIRLHLASEVHDLWLKTEDELQDLGLPPPFWAFAWAGGQGLARHILDNPGLVRARTVLDFASGSGLVAIAAMMAGAAHVVAADIDPWSETAIAMNAAANGLAVSFEGRDLIGTDLDADVILAGDVFYDADFANALQPWFSRLVAEGRRVIVGDPGRAYLPRDKLIALGTYQVPVTRVLEDSDVKKTTVWEFRADPQGRMTQTPAS